MQRSVLIVDEQDTRRRGFASSLAARGVRSLDVGDAFAGMAALGRADFGVVLAAEGRRTLSLRGLCQLARKRHPDILIFVLPKEGTTEEHLREVLELDFEVLPVGLSTEKTITHLVAHVEAANEPTQLAAKVQSTTSEIPSDHLFSIDVNPFDMPSTEDVNGVFDSVPRVEVPRLASLEDPTEAPATPLQPPAQGQAPQAVALPVDEHTRPDARLSTSSATQSADAPIVVDGHFDDVDGGAGATFMMSAFAQEFTGRLVVAAGAAAGALYLFRGEPVWAEDPEGDAGLYRKLVQKQFLAPDQAIEPLPEGQLLGGLMQAGLLTSAQMHDFMREVVRDRVIAVALEQAGPYRFIEDRSFLDTAPLFRVNPFGLILESRRRALPPPALMAVQSELEGRYVIPAPALAAASDKLAPFLRGAIATALITGQRTIAATLEVAGLDPFMGTLVVVAMRDAGLISIESAPRAQGLDLSAGTLSPGEFDMVVDTELSTVPPTSPEEAQAREDIYALYMRLKPLTQPRQVLGVGVDADVHAVDHAYRLRLAELDPARIPEGSAQHILTQRIEELRRKVTSAYQTLTLQLSADTLRDDDGTNPF